MIKYIAEPVRSDLPERWFAFMVKTAVSVDITNRSNICWSKHGRLLISAQQRSRKPPAVLFSKQHNYSNIVGEQVFQSRWIYKSESKNKPIKQIHRKPSDISRTHNLAKEITIKKTKKNLRETRDERPLDRESDRSWCHRHTTSMIKLFWSQPMATWGPSENK